MKSLNLNVETLHEDRVVYLNGNGNIRTFSVWDLVDIFYDHEKKTTKIRTEANNRLGYRDLNCREGIYDILFRAEKCKNRHYLANESKPESYFRWFSEKNINYGEGS